MPEIATFHIAPHFTSHHNSHQITPPHFGSPFHITLALHLAPRHTHHHIQIQIAHHTIPQHTFQTTPHIPHCISTIIPHHTMSNMASNHSTSLCIPQPHFTSCITTHHHIPHDRIFSVRATVNDWIFQYVLLLMTGSFSTCYVLLMTGSLQYVLLR